MGIILAKEKHIIPIIDIINSSRKFLKDNNIDQWQGDYPAEADILADIYKSKGYVYRINNEIGAYFCLDFEGEPAYEHIDGSWLSNSSYAVIHRLAVSNKYKGMGLTYKILDYIYKVLKKEKIRSIRIDTDINNHIMRHIIEKNHFIYCGNVILDNKPKLAYEKLIEL